MDKVFKILSWNINGLRSQKGYLKTLLDDLGAEIICLQETKITRDQLEEALAIVDGYHSFFSFSRKRSGYSGVATFCKKEAMPSYAQEGLGGTVGVGSLDAVTDPVPDAWDSKELKELDAEGRCIITQHVFQDAMGVQKMVSVINVYCPRADPDRPERALFKLSFYELMRQRAVSLRGAGSHVIIIGDINTSHRRIDHCEPDDDPQFDKRDDRLFLDNFLFNTSQRPSSDCPTADSPDDDGEDKAALRVVDTFRHLHPSRRNAFTCWNTRVNARSTNYGTRIDYALCDPEFLAHVQDASIHPDVVGSDHCPVSLSLAGLVATPPPHAIPPPMCTKFYPEFHGSQQKLSYYFKTSKEGNVRDVASCVNGKETSSESAKSISNSELMLKITKRKSGAQDGIGAERKRKCASKSGQPTLSSFFARRDSSQSLSTSDSSESVSGSKSEGDTAAAAAAASSRSWLRAGWADEGSSGGGTRPPLYSHREAHFPKGEPVISLSSTSFSDSCKTSSASWGFLMKGCPDPPMCSGHKEQCVLRTVKKKGPNLNKQFYACPKGVGKEKDPNSKCNYFKWVKIHKK